MANRSFDQQDLTIQKRVVSLFGVFTLSGTTPALQKWNYPTLGTGANARTYTAAPIAAAPPSGTGPWPLQYSGGCEGIFSVVRTATGLWTIKLQDNYQRLLGIAGFQTIAGGTANIVGFSENSTLSAMGTAGGSVIGLALLSATGTLADPTSGSSITLRLRLHDATEP